MMICAGTCRTKHIQFLPMQLSQQLEPLQRRFWVVEKAKSLVVFELLVQFKQQL